MRILSIEQNLQVLPLFDNYVGVVHDGAARWIDKLAGVFHTEDIKNVLETSCQ